MADMFQMVTRERHTYKKWLRFSDYRFAASVSAVPLAAGELFDAARACALAFMDIDGGPTLAAVLGLRSGQSLFVAPDGRWLGAHVPFALRAYPFNLARTAEGKFVLCVNEGSGLVRDAAVGEEGAPFFAADGKPAPETQQIVDTLTHARRGFDTVRAATAALAARNLLEPWPLTARDETGERRIGGLMRVSEAALNAVGAEDLMALRDAGGLAIAYGQLLSIGNAPILGNLADAHNRAAQQRVAGVAAHNFLLEDDGNLKIDWASFLKDD
jgi:hypothetical protein